MELLVLLLIAYEVLPPIWKKRRTNLRVATIVKAMHDGQLLQRRVPTPNGAVEDAEAWLQNLQNVAPVSV